MKILFVSNDLIAGHLSLLLHREGHDVHLFIEEKSARENFNNLVPKTNNWRQDLSWVGTDGLIIFDDVGYGAIQDKLREEGYTVFGGSELGEKLETDREFGQQIFKVSGLQIAELKNFFDIKSAISFIRKNPKRWVLKHNNHSFKSLTYTGHMDTGEDVVNVLESYNRNGLLKMNEITLQEYVDGIEMGVGRFFNGYDWVGPIEVNFEHTRLFPGDIGPVTSEMGTLAWYDNDEKNKLFTETLAKLKPFLVKANFRGDISVNCIVNQKGAFPLEATARLGSPIVHLQSEINSSPWGDLLFAVASGQKFNLKWKKGYGVVVTVALPPFPYNYKLDKNSSYNTDIHFSRKVTQTDLKHIHFEEVALRGAKEVQSQYYISDRRGYAMYVTGFGSTISQARQKAYKLLLNIKIPQMFYRHDIGAKFVKHDYLKLVKWGYLKHISKFVFSDQDSIIPIKR